MNMSSLPCLPVEQHMGCACLDQAGEDCPQLPTGLPANTVQVDQM